MAFVLEVDLSVARTNEPFEVDARQIYVIKVDADATFKLEKTNSAAIPALKDAEVCACEGDTIRRIFVTNAAAAAGAELIFNVV